MDPAPKESQEPIDHVLRIDEAWGKKLSMQNST